MRPVGKPVLFALSIGMVAVSMVALGPRILDLAGGPDAALGAALRQTEKDGLTLEVPGAHAPLISRQHHFDRISTHVENADSAYAVSTLDFSGAIGSTQVSSLGLEKTPFHRRGGRWRAEEGVAPRLTAILVALEARRQALERGQAAPGSAAEEFVQRVSSMRDRRYEVGAWYIRAERDDAVVTEDYRLQGTLEGHAVDERGTRRLALQRQGAQFFFAHVLL